MTSAELKDILQPVAVWMASAAVMKGVEAFHNSRIEKNKEDVKKEAGFETNYILVHAYYEGVRIAAGILWKMFASCTNDCIQAIEKVAESMNGYSGSPDTYFETFVDALETVKGYPVRLRDNQ